MLRDSLKVIRDQEKMPIFLVKFWLVLGFSVGGGAGVHSIPVHHFTEKHLHPQLVTCLIISTCFYM